MKTQNNGLVETHDGNRKERGFCCMKLITFLTADGVTDWDEWHQAHQQANQGECKYQKQCPIYKQTKIKSERNKIKT